MDWLSLIVSYSWSSQVETSQELTSLAGKLNLVTIVFWEKEKFLQKMLQEDLRGDYCNLPPYS